MAKLAASTYSNALFELALEKNVLNDYANEVNVLKEAFTENEDLIKLLNHPKVTREEKVNVVETIFKGRLSDDITGFLVVIVEKGRIGELFAIFEDFFAKVKEYKKIGVAYVTSAIALNDTQKAQVETKLLATTDYVTFEMHYEVSKDLIGGMVIRIGDRIVDNSIKTSLSLMSQKLSKLQLSQVEK